MTSEAKPAATTIGSWLQRLRPTMLLCVGCTLAVIAGLDLKRAPAVIAYFAVVGLVSIWLFSRICRMGVRFDDRGVMIRRVFRKMQLSWYWVSHFADGENVVSRRAGLRHWVLQIVLIDGRSFAVPGTITISGVAHRKVVAKINQVTGRYQIPAQVTGELPTTTVKRREGGAEGNGPQLDAYGLPVRRRSYAAAAYGLALASFVCGIVLMGLAVSHMIGRHKPDNLLLLGILPAVAAFVAGGRLQQHPDKRISRIAKAGAMLAVLSFFALVIASGHGAALNDAG